MWFLIIGSILFAVLIALSAFFSGSETALTSMTKLRVKRLFGEDGGHYARLELWLQNPRRYLTTILIGNNVVNVAAAILASALTEKLLLMVDVGHVDAFASGLAFCVVTFLLLTFGEIIPKNYCKEHAPMIAQNAIRPLDVLYRFLRPFVVVFVGISNFVIRITGGAAIHEVPVLTEDEIRHLIEVSEREGVIEEDEREMIHSIIDFGDTFVQQVMVPRVDIHGLDIETDGVEDARKMAVETGHSRLPVFKHDLDEIIGVLYAKDLLLTNGDKEKKELKDLVRPSMYVPKGKRVSDLLQAFRQDRTHMAIVVDEYGCTAGLVTIEDVLEEIVGDIQDEYDSEQPPFQVSPDGAIITDAKADLDDLEEEFDIQLQLPEGEFGTVGGFVTSYLGYVPLTGESFTFENYEITILEADTRKVDRVSIHVLEIPQESDEDGNHSESSGAEPSQPTQ